MVGKVCITSSLVARLGTEVHGWVTQSSLVLAKVAWTRCTDPGPGTFSPSWIHRGRAAARGARVLERSPRSELRLLTQRRRERGCWRERRWVGGAGGGWIRQEEGCGVTWGDGGK